MLNYLRLMRPADWVKNVFILPAFIFTVPALVAADTIDLAPTMAMATVWTIVAFSLLASGVYAVNDAIDHERDRLHPVKKRRPIASGAVTPRAGVVLAIVLACAGMAVGWVVSRSVGMCLVMYVLLQLLYNLGLKRVVVVDAVVLALGFSLRSAAGAFAIGVAVSTWLLGLVFFLTLYLAFIKRQCDRTTAIEANASWTSPAGYDDPLELNWLLSLSGVTVVLSWILYALSSHAEAVFGVRAAGFAMLTPLVLITVHRFYRRSHQGRSDSPLAAFLEDRVTAVCFVLFVAGMAACLYAPWVEIALAKLIYLGPQSFGL
jgi:decaprenyl-phosphate phosphoribosyltransferase